MSAAPRKSSFVDAVMERLKHFEVPEGLQRPLRIFGYPVFGVLVGLIAFAAALPRDKIKERLEFLLSQEPSAMQPMGLGMDVKAGELSLSLLSRGIRAENVVLRTRPMRTADKPSRFVLDTVRLNIGIIGAMLQHPTYKFSIDAFEGNVEGTIKVSEKEAHYDIEGVGLSLGAVQGLQNAVSGLPVEGKLEGKFELDAPGRLVSTADGSLDLNIDGASIGDGKALLIIATDPFLAQGVTMPRIRIGKVQVNVVIEKGRARLETVKAHSADVDITVEGSIDLRDPLPLSLLHLYVRFKLSDELIKKEPTLGLVTTSLAAGKRTDGYFGAQVTGSLASPLFVPNLTPPAGVISKIAAPPYVSPTPSSTTTTPVTPMPSPSVAPPPSSPPPVDAAQENREAPPPPRTRAEIMQPPPTRGDEGGAPQGAPPPPPPPE